MRGIIIAMDGYAGTGKSSTAKEVAKALKYRYIDSGAMYRCVTRHFIDHQVDLENEGQVEVALNQLVIKFNFNEALNQSEILLNDRVMDKEIRLPEINEAVSKISANPIVRKKLVVMQQQLGTQKDIVMDGRDICTVVFPEAELKIFMSANLDIRSQRRFDETKAKNIKVDFEEIKQNLADRDHLDTTRQDSPLMKAKGAIEIDTSYLTFQEQVDKIMEYANQLIYAS
ncbi:MAG: (d)CMP kinase [Flammeovirgaceae bacterium]|jgi:CMP/dCMP kinase|nr:(d)CMP kinase [Flammeovirgaceae bacterium]|tara:strand:- start:4253 stop:4936 length:684 start_codon:yes stop_codon:yes gene_type:complete